MAGEAGKDNVASFRVVYAALRDVCFDLSPLVKGGIVLLDVHVVRSIICEAVCQASFPYCFAIINSRRQVIERVITLCVSILVFLVPLDFVCLLIDHLYCIERYASEGEHHLDIVVWEEVLVLHLLELCLRLRH